MKRFAKIFITALLIVLLFISCDGSVASFISSDNTTSEGAFEYGGVRYESLQKAVDAISASRSGRSGASYTIKVNKDVIARGVTISNINGTITFDLDGHIVSFVNSGEAAIVVENQNTQLNITSGSLILMDSETILSVNSSTVCLQEDVSVTGNVTATSSKVYVQDYSSLSGTINADSSTVTVEDDAAYKGSVTLNGSTFNAQSTKTPKVNVLTMTGSSYVTVEADKSLYLGSADITSGSVNVHNTGTVSTGENCDLSSHIVSGVYYTNNSSSERTYYESLESAVNAAPGQTIYQVLNDLNDSNIPSDVSVVTATGKEISGIINVYSGAALNISGSGTVSEINGNGSVCFSGTSSSSPVIGNVAVPYVVFEYATVNGEVEATTIEGSYSTFSGNLSASGNIEISDSSFNNNSASVVSTGGNVILTNVIGKLNTVTYSGTTGTDSCTVVIDNTEAEDTFTVAEDVKSADGDVTIKGSSSYAVSVEGKVEGSAIVTEYAAFSDSVSAGNSITASNSTFKKAVSAAQGNIYIKNSGFTSDSGITAEAGSVNIENSTGTVGSVTAASDLQSVTIANTRVSSTLTTGDISAGNQGRGAVTVKGTSSKPVTVNGKISGSTVEVNHANIAGPVSSQSDAVFASATFTTGSSITSGGSLSITESEGTVGSVSAGSGSLTISGTASSVLEVSGEIRSSAALTGSYLSFTDGSKNIVSEAGKITLSNVKGTAGNVYISGSEAYDIEISSCGILSVGNVFAVNGAAGVTLEGGSDAVITVGSISRASSVNTSYTSLGLIGFSASPVTSLTDRNSSITSSVYTESDISFEGSVFSAPHATIISDSGSITLTDTTGSVGSLTADYSGRSIRVDNSEATEALTIARIKCNAEDGTATVTSSSKTAGTVTVSGKISSHNLTLKDSAATREKSAATLYVSSVDSSVINIYGGHYGSRTSQFVFEAAPSAVNTYYGTVYVGSSNASEVLSAFLSGARASDGETDYTLYPVNAVICQDITLENSFNVGSAELGNRKIINISGEDIKTPYSFKEADGLYHSFCPVLYGGNVTVSSVLRAVSDSSVSGGYQDSTTNACLAYSENTVNLNRALLYSGGEIVSF